MWIIGSLVILMLCQRWFLTLLVRKAFRGFRVQLITDDDNPRLTIAEVLAVTWLQAWRSVLPGIILGLCFRTYEAFVLDVSQVVIGKPLPDAVRTLC
jgi:hypothetical protein